MSNETGQKTLEFEDALRDRAYVAPGLTKEGFDERVMRLTVSHEVKMALLPFRTLSKARFHMVRMLERVNSPVERLFALALLEHATGIVDELENSKNQATAERYDDAEYVITMSEQPNMVMFWTMAPYLYEELTARGVSPKMALRAVILWAGDWNTEDPADFRRKITLKGLERYKDKPTFTLGTDPNGASHLFARQEAKRIVDEYFTKEFPNLVENA